MFIQCTVLGITVGYWSLSNQIVASICVNIDSGFKFPDFHGERTWPQSKIEPRALNLSLGHCTSQAKNLIGTVA